MVYVRLNATACVYTNYLDWLLFLFAIFLCGTATAFYLSINYTYELWHFLPDGGHSSVCVGVCLFLLLHPEDQILPTKWRHFGWSSQF